MNLYRIIFAHWELYRFLLFLHVACSFDGSTCVSRQSYQLYYPLSQRCLWHRRCLILIGPRSCVGRTHMSSDSEVLTYFPHRHFSVRYLPDLLHLKKSCLKLLREARCKCIRLVFDHTLSETLIPLSDRLYFSSISLSRSQ